MNGRELGYQLLDIGKMWSELTFLLEFGLLLAINYMLWKNSDRMYTYVSYVYIVTANS